MRGRGDKEVCEIIVGQREVSQPGWERDGEERESLKSEQVPLLARNKQEDELVRALVLKVRK